MRDELKVNALAECPVEETQRRRLERSKKHFQDRIADIDRALALLDKNPDIEELQDILRRV